MMVQVVAWTVNKLQEWLASPVIEADAGLRAQEEDNIEYCLTLLPK
jgi:dedicator of cytokinesis protein 3